MDEYYNEDEDNKFQERVEDERFYDVIHFDSKNMKDKCTKYIISGIPCIGCPGPNVLSCYKKKEEEN